MHMLIGLVVRIYLWGRLKVTGQELIPRTGPLIVCSNHPSSVDPLIVALCLPRRDSWSMAKSEWFVGWIGWLFRWLHAFPVVRDSPDRTAIRKALGILERGEALIIFPEGRVEWGCMEHAKGGSGLLARLSGASVLPVGVVNTERCVPRGEFWPRRVRLEVRFGKPIQILPRRSDGRKVSNQEAMDAIMLAIAKLLPSPMRGAYADLDDLEFRLRGVSEFL
ncbi:MAG: lysophospholipid acyltransferase family protein [Candidatus Dormibacteraceae bacterium]